MRLLSQYTSSPTSIRGYLYAQAFPALSSLRRVAVRPALTRRLSAGRCSDTLYTISLLSLQKDQQHIEHVAAVRRGLEIPQKDLEDLQAEIEAKYEGNLSSLLDSRQGSQHSHLLNSLRCFEFISLVYFFTEDPDHTEPPLTALAKADEIALGEQARRSVLHHLRDIRQHTEEEFGQENILDEVEAQQIMIEVPFYVLAGSL